jgi:hypothetical protein
MDRTEITAAVVAEIESLLAEGSRRNSIAARLGISRYVVEVIAGDRHRNERRLAPAQLVVSRRVPNSQKGIDAVTVRMVQRMLTVGILSHVEIAREAGVSDNTVSDVATGKRLARSTWAPYVQEDERFLAEPVRCSVCRASISVVPCRACRTRRQAGAQKSV